MRFAEFESNFTLPKTEIEGDSMKTLSDQALLDAYKKAKLLNLSSEFILLIEEELKKRQLGSITR
ncbi:hypothetical protein RKD55_001018 [Rossellomorea marisflavi]